MTFVSFDSPWFLLLLAGLPVMWLASYRSLAALGPLRRLAALALRSLVFVLIVAALAETARVQSTDRLTVLYLLDESLSIDPDEGQAALDYVNSALRRRPGGKDEDRAGVIVFGREAAVEIPPLAEAQQITRVEAHVDREHTNVAAALKMAQAAFAHDTAKRVVLVSDGNENLGNAAEQARILAESGVGIDVVPLRGAPRAEVAVEKVAVPDDVQRGQPFDLRVVVSNFAQTGGDASALPGRLQVIRKAGGREQVVSDQPLVLEPGKHVFSVREQIDLPEFYTYDARFIPDDPAGDAMPQNNRATAFTQVRGSGRVLLIEDADNKGEFDFLVARLASENLEVVVRGTRSDELFSNLVELQAFDTVVLANAPREQFSDAQIEMLVRNTSTTGGGLVMLGGPNSFGAGGWTGTALEAAMPVDFQIKNLKVAPVGALVLVIDRSGSMAGEKIQMSKAAAIASLRMLGPQDQIGVIAFDFVAHQVVPLQKVGEAQDAVRRVARLGSDGGTNMMPGMDAGYRALESAEASMKHMIVLTDGHTEGTGYQALTARMRAKGITTTCVAVGADSDTALMQSIAAAGGGQFYRVEQPRTIPRIFMKEARRVARPVVFESETPFSTTLRLRHEMLQGIDELPPITGYVMTTPKNNPLAEISVTSPLPSQGGLNPILASWTYGLGKTVALTTDAGKRWATAWTNWPNYDRLLSQVVRWSMRPPGDSGKFAINTELGDGRVRVVVTATDAGDAFLNFLNIDASVVAPDLSPLELTMKQVAPGRYVGSFDASQTGSHLVVVNPGLGRTPIRAGVNVPYSAEFRQRVANEPLLAVMARGAAKGAPSGKIIDAPAGLPPGERVAQWLATDTFRHDLPKATSTQPIWPWLVLAGSCLLVVDVAVRRVALGLDALAGPIARFAAKVLHRSAPVQADATIERLRGRKREVAGELRQKSAALRFESDGTTRSEAANSLRSQPAAEAAPAADPGRPQIAPARPDEPSYTERLLRAKREARSRLPSETWESDVDG